MPSSQTAPFLQGPSSHSLMLTAHSTPAKEIQRWDLTVGSHRGTETPSQSLPGTALPSSLQGAAASKEPHTHSEGRADDARARKPKFCVLPRAIYRALACQPKSPHQLLSCAKLKPHRQSMCRRYGRTKTAQTRNLCFFLNRFGMLKGQLGL